MVYLPKNDIVLLADGPNNRILALQPKTGEVSEVYQNNDFCSIWHLYLQNDLILSLDGIDVITVISYFTVSMSKKQSKVNYRSHPKHDPNKVVLENMSVNAPGHKVRYWASCCARAVFWSCKIAIAICCSF